MISARPLAALLLACLAAACGGKDDEEVHADTPSGYPVPRWISVSGAPASMRAGPGTDYPILWRFEQSGAPLQVVTETHEWRKVCGPDGSMAWIHRTLTSGRRRVIAEAETPVLARPQEGSEVRARLLPGALIGLTDEGCESGWCRVRVEDRQGWVPEQTLFGVQTAALCDPRAEATRGRIRLQPGAASE
jgi:SH3-like domain-containing protein